MACEMDKEAIFSPFGIYHSQHCCHFLIVWFRIITATIQTDIGEGRNTRDKEGASHADHRQERHAPSIRQLSRIDTQYNKPWSLTGCCVCFAKNKSTRTKFKCPECNMGMCAISQ